MRGKKAYVVHTGLDTKYDDVNWSKLNVLAVDAEDAIKKAKTKLLKNEYVVAVKMKMDDFIN